MRPVSALPRLSTVIPHMPMTFLQLRAPAESVRYIPLEIILHLTGATQHAQDRAKWHTPKGIVSITGIKFMNWTEHRGGGGAISGHARVTGAALRPPIFDSPHGAGAVSD